MKSKLCLSFCADKVPNYRVGTHPSNESLLISVIWHAASRHQLTAHSMWICILFPVMNAWRDVEHLFTSAAHCLRFLNGHGRGEEEAGEKPAIKFQFIASRWWEGVIHVGYVVWFRWWTLSTADSVPNNAASSLRVKYIILHVNYCARPKWIIHPAWLIIFQLHCSYSAQMTVLMFLGPFPIWWVDDRVLQRAPPHCHFNLQLDLMCMGPIFSPSVLPRLIF